MVSCFILGLASTVQVFAQDGAIKGIRQSFDSYRKHALQEKLYLHIDRPAYVCGETMRFKVYNVDGTLHQPLSMSKVVYVEVLDAAQQPVLQGKVAMEEGTGNGSFVLPVSLNSGNYTVRAYTNWMKNFSPEFYFQSPVTIVNTFRNQEQERHVAQKPGTYALQLFPEGGNLVAGVSGKVAFKGVDTRTGEGTSFEGELRDQDGNLIITFQPLKFGIGHFTFTPERDQVYTALLKIDGKQVAAQKLPQVYVQGYGLQVEDLNDRQLKITLAAPALPAEQVYLLGHARQMIATSASGTLTPATPATFLVDKSALADGITHFTVFNSQKQPVAERLYFKRPTKELHLKASTEKSSYATREKVSLELMSEAVPEHPASANLSLAVYRLDSLATVPPAAIDAYLWLSSDLKGIIENPSYYFDTQNPDADEALDNLMLTHGWSRFRWEDILNGKEPAYEYVPEYAGHLVRGKVTDNETGAIASGIKAYLAAPGKHIRMYNATSDEKGRIQFELKDFYGPKEIVVQTNTQRDSTYHLEIFNPFSVQYSPLELKELDLTERLRQALTERHLAVQVQHAYQEKYLNLFRNPGVDSVAFYGKPNEQYKLDDYTRFKVMEEVMREYVPGVQVRKRKDGFHFMVKDSPNGNLFYDNPMVLLDGVPVFDIDKIMAFDPLKVKRLDVMTGKYFNGPLTYSGLVSYATYNGDLAGFQLDPRSLLQEYEGLQLEREFYAPVYEEALQQQSRLADFRNLLYWAPDIRLQANSGEKLSFYTSDQPGTYVVVVQGVSKDGRTGSKTFTFKVNQQPL
ncbi:hypothetical protein CLV24_10711 [Pontibacter ummariensis]|uniref:MG2 domain-containing protein n=2 Tax=Pontibacter ummariensis TaxID=1610492 RepID=A0A239F3J9_9BACT|nr:hypothetical protein CLV24_10711 [Pontibacter ummariensis]SNS50674.1 hypothetical protein SAMN06296052_107177 [Pontibacter ummariensis]